MKIDIVNRTKEKIPVSHFRRDALVAGRMLGRRRMPSFLAIVCVLPKESQRLKKKYLGKEKPANVLSFRYDDEYADIILTPSVIKIEAKRSKASFIHLLRRMVVHGLVHVAGFEHERAGVRRKQFETREGRILSKLKVHQASG